MSVNPALRKLRQEDCQPEPCREILSQNNKNRKEEGRKEGRQDHDLQLHIVYDSSFLFISL
jgi:hypothetical protein